MGRGLTFVVVLGLAAAGLYFALQSGLLKFNVNLNAGVCRHDDEIGTTLREGSTQAALTFVDTLLKSNATTPAYEQLTAEMKAAHTADQFNATAKTIQSSGPYANIKIDHVYEPSVTGGGSPRVLCGTLGKGGNWVAIEAKPGVTQTHTVLLGSTRNNDWAFTLWQIKEAGAWRVHGYYLSLASMVGHFPADLLARAREQDQKGHALNAHMLYVAANSLLNRGPSFQLGIKQDIDAAFAQHKAPSELTGGPPFKWLMNGVEYSVTKVEILGVDKKLVLLLHWRDPDWNGKDNKEADRRNRAFLDAFIKTHPEYKETFGLLVARIFPASGPKYWGSVFDAEKGYH